MLPMESNPEASLGTKTLNSNEFSGVFMLKLLHGGSIDLSMTSPLYLGGRIDFFDEEDADEIGFIALKENVKELGYNNIEELVFFSFSDLGLVKLVFEKQVWSLTKSLGPDRVLEIWVV
ncbi:unnamed protein product [Cuscuta epithymum]|uniref:PB1-like domain-containing protein n=1 Tax=Cuscuta epithymum TaxID=186058 RepID=A0AAV0DV50_9ASTE|nr:unnamed protein product [Cuscuta epithymum]